ncbi:MAG: DUF1570 domain-containing protein [Archangium sp.]
MSGCATLDQLEQVPWFVAEEGGTRVLTPISARVASSTVEQLELRRRAMDAVFGGGGEGGVVEVVVLPSAPYESLFPKTAGVFLGTHEPLLALQSYSDLTFLNGTSGTTQVHELAHAYVARRIGRLPRWLNEGLAVWLETLSVDDEAITLGKIQGRKLRSATSAGRVAFEGLSEWESLGQLSEAATHEMYAAAWAWVAWLLSEEPDRFTRFLRNLQEKDANAWVDAFDGSSPTEQTLNTFLKFGRTLMLKLPRSSFTRAQQTNRAATPVEKYGVLARLKLFDPLDPKHEGTRDMAKKGLAIDPNDRVLRPLASVQPDGSFTIELPERKFRPAVALAPETHPECDDIEATASLEGRAHLRPRTWLPEGEDVWPQSTEGESYERRLELEGQQIELLGSSSRAKTSIGIGLELAGNPRSPFLIVRRPEKGGGCVVGAWRAELLADAELRNLQTWVSKDKKLALVLLGFSVGKEKRWVVLGVTKTKVWFALQSKGMTQAITPLAGFLPNADGSVDVVFGNVDAWRLIGEKLVQQPPASR